MWKHALLELYSNRLAFVDRGIFTSGERRPVVLKHTPHSLCLSHWNLAAVHRPRNPTRSRYLGIDVDTDCYVVDRVQFFFEWVTVAFAHYPLCKQELKNGHV